MRDSLHAHVVLSQKNCLRQLLPVLRRLNQEPRYRLSVTNLIVEFNRDLRRENIAFANDRTLFDQFLREQGPRVFLSAADFVHPAHRSTCLMIDEARARAIPSLSLQHGFFSSAQLHNPVHHFYSDRTAVWGDHFRDLHLKAIPGLAADRVTVVGCPRLDEIPATARDEGLSEHNRAILGLERHEDFVLVATTTHALLHNLGNNAQAAEDVMRLYAGMFRSLQRTHPASVLVIKPHPAETLGSKDALSVLRRSIELSGHDNFVLLDSHSSERLAYFPLLRDAQLVAASGLSTLCIEGLLMGTPSVVCHAPRLPGDEEFRFLEASKAWRMIQTSDQEDRITPALREVAPAKSAEPLLDASLISNRFTALDGNSTQRLLSAIDQLVDDYEAGWRPRKEAKEASVTIPAAAAPVPSQADAEPPLCSIIIPLFNKVEFTQKCLEGLIEHTPGDMFEVILVDNGSTDGTAEFLRCLEGDLTIISNPQNLGFARACNQGAAAARGRYLMFLNNDTLPHPGWLEPLVKQLEQRPEVAIVGSRLLFPDGSLQHAGVEVIENRTEGVHLDFRHRFYRYPGTYPEAMAAEDVKVVTGAAMMVRAEAFQRAGGFNEAYWNGYEDVDLCLTLGRLGCQIVYEPESCLTHFESVSGPERWTKVRENIQLMQDRWLGRVAPDVVFTPEGVERADEDGRSPRPTVPGKVSIVVLAYNQLPYNVICVETVLANSDLPFELILVDNGSNDGTGEYFRSVAARDSRVRAVINPENRGFAIGCNQGAALAEGEYVVFLNNDTVAPRQWLSRLVAHFRAHPGLGAVGPVSNCVSGPQQLEKIPFPNDPNAMAEILDFADQLGEVGRGQGADFPRLVGFCLMVRREVLDRIGGFDPQFGLGNFEDDDFCLRLRMAGYGTRIACDVYIHHFGSRTFSLLGPDVYKRSLERGLMLFKSKWGLQGDVTMGQLVERGQAPFVPHRHHVALPCVDDTRWFPEPEGADDEPFPLDGKRALAFFHHPTWASDGWKAVLHSYVQAFAPEEDVTLVIWLDPAQGLSEGQAADMIVGALREAGVDPAHTPDLLLVPEALSDAGLGRLYRSIDVVVPGAHRPRSPHATVLASLSREDWRAPLKVRQAICALAEGRR